MDEWQGFCVECDDDDDDDDEHVATKLMSAVRRESKPSHIFHVSKNDKHNAS